MRKFQVVAALFFCLSIKGLAQTENLDSLKQAALKNLKFIFVLDKELVENPDVLQKDKAKLIEKGIFFTNVDFSLNPTEIQKNEAQILFIHKKNDTVYLSFKQNQYHIPLENFSLDDFIWYFTADTATPFIIPFMFIQYRILKSNNNNLKIKNKVNPDISNTCITCIKEKDIISYKTNKIILYPDDYEKNFSPLQVLYKIKTKKKKTIVEIEFKNLEKFLDVEKNKVYYKNAFMEAPKDPYYLTEITKKDFLLEFDTDTLNWNEVEKKTKILLINLMLMNDKLEYTYYIE